MAPESLFALPPQAGRAVSGLVFSTKIGDKQGFGTELSDKWHDEMRAEGWRRWTMEGPKNFIFGDGITPSEQLSSNLRGGRDEYAFVEFAANEGDYENGLDWELGLLGSVGFVLYALFFSSSEEMYGPISFDDRKGHYGKDWFFGASIQQFFGTWIVISKVQALPLR